jgi:hypothetical protein
LKFHSKRITTAVAFFLVFATSQIYVGARFTEPGTKSATSPQQTTGILTTQGNNQIAVNGANTISGATVVSGARIETPAGVGATVRLGSLGWLDIAPQTLLSLTFDPSGRVNVVLTQGCVVLHTKQNTTGQIETADGVIGKSDPTKDDVLRVCSERGAVPPPGTGAGTVLVAGAPSAGGGLATSTKVLIGLAVAGGVVAAAIIVPCRRGANPSPGEPRGRNDECR